MEIPKQLRNDDFRFILANTKTKSPIEEKWNTDNNYFYNHSKILERLKEDNSYGVLGGSGNDKDGYILPIDADCIELSTWIEKNCPETFTVQSGSQEPGKYHYYYLTNKPYNKIVLSMIDKEKGEEKRYGEIQGKGAMVIGPGCIHQSGNRYEVIRDGHLVKISNELLEKMREKFSNVIEVDEEEIKKFQVRDFEKGDIEEQLNVTHVFSLNGLKRYRDEYYGSHPVHGSNTRMNFWVNPTKNIWSCFRHNKCGGGVAWAIAVNEGLKDCSEAHGSLDKKTYKEVLKIAKEKYGYVDNSDGKILPAEARDEMAQIEEDIFGTPEDDLRRNINKFLERINGIDNEIFKKYLISKIAFKIKVGKREIEKELNKISMDNEGKNPMAISDLLEKDIPEVEYYIEPIVPKGKLILIGGKPGQGKSLVSLGMSLGLKGNDKYLNEFSIRERPKILYYDLENGENLIKWRLEYLMKGMKVDKQNLKDFHLEQNFNKKNIEKELELSKGFDFIVLDSYRRFLEGAEDVSEITDKFFNEYLKPLKDLGKTIIILHHFKKADLIEISDDDLMDIFRGSSDIPAQFDIIYGLIRSPEVQNENKTSFEISLLKVKNREGLPIKNFTMKVIKDDIEKKTDFIFLDYGKMLSPKEKVQKKILELLKQKGEVARKVIYELVISETGAENSSSCDRWLKEMVSNGFIQNSGYGKYKMAGEEDPQESTND